MSERPKFVQIAVTAPRLEPVDSIYALDEDGTVWVWDWHQEAWAAFSDNRAEPRGHISDEPTT